MMTRKAFLTQHSSSSVTENNPRTNINNSTLKTIKKEIRQLSISSRKQSMSTGRNPTEVFIDIGGIHNGAGKKGADVVGVVNLGARSERVHKDF